MTVEERLATLAVEYGLPEPAVEALGRLLSALAAEPDPHTAVVEPRQAVDYHIADSLTGLGIPAVRNAHSVVDIGAGAGFPGLPLAVALPSTRVDLIESARRKCGVIQRLAAAAALENARPLAVRAETWAANEGRGAYDIATARAVAPLAVLVEYAAPLLRPGGTFVAWKGARDSSEETAGHIAAELVGLEPSEVVPVRPFDAARDLNLYLYLKVKETPSRFPRRPGVAAKRPLA
jgi:16S rRNA (guanine527-N7)-methyltransferase